ncbi:MAG: zinc-binding dehydrogenase [Planctomycetota bacterium]|nr:zinc-binding dehydrogenase [Planctomycetota bacterium]
MPKAIRFFRSVPRWLLVRTCFPRWRGLSTGALSCIELAETAPPPLPTPEWVRIKTRLSGVCGSDLAAIACQGSPYFSPFVSTPFVLGHELVGEIVEVGAKVPVQWRAGMRVVIEPALSCAVRGVEPPCRPCAAGEYAHCENILQGSIKGGIQTGYCASTGGGWSEATVVAHHCQLHAVPPALSDEEAVLAEPFSCAIHAALKAPRGKDATLLVLGSGTIGLLTVYAYRAAGGQGRVLATARFPCQAEMAEKLGANEISPLRPPGELYRWVLERTAGASSDGQAGVYQPEIGKPVALGGADCVLDCVGSSQSIDDAMRLTRPRGTLVLTGMPGIAVGVDWTSVWYKALCVQGSYAYGWETLSDGRTLKTMQLALEFLQKSGGALKPLVNRTFPLAEYRAALAGAFDAGRNGAFKTVFEVQ